MFISNVSETNTSVFTLSITFSGIKIVNVNITEMMLLSEGTILHNSIDDGTVPGNICAQYIS